MKKKIGMTYAGSGVSYADMDPFKIACQQRASKTSENARRHGVKSLEWTRGESVFLFDLGGHCFGHVEEGLGTKSLVADVMYKITGRTFYDKIAQCTIAMIVNDGITLGVFPYTLAMHLAVGSSEWFENEQRVKDLISGWGNTCDMARCVWAGGETPTLIGIILPEACLLSGSVMGEQRGNIHPARIEEGDAIVFFESSGIHANGLTLARKIADNLPDGYRTPIYDGRMYGEALLDPTHIYSDFVEDCLKAGVDIHYAVNITGHGWRKLMRAKQSFAYVIETLPTQLPIFDFIQKHGPVDDEEAYGNLNMGAGFAIYISEFDIEKIPQSDRFKVFKAGHIEKSTEKKVVIIPKGIEFKSDTLAVR